MRDIDSSALSDVGKLLGIAAPARLTQPTSFDDEVLQQVLDVIPAIRRGAGLPQGPIWAFDLAIDLPGPGAARGNDSIEPFAVLEAQFPHIELDIWLYTICARRYSGSGTVAKGQIALDFPRWIGDEPVDELVWVDAWEGTYEPYSQAPAGRPIMKFKNGDLVRDLNMRIQPGAKLTFIAEADADALITCRVTAGLFPARAGQDGRV